MSTDEYTTKLATLACLREPPEFEAFLALQDNSQGNHDRWLTWLDESGLTLYLAQRLSEHRLMLKVAPQIRAALETRIKANAHRTQDLLSEFARVNRSLGRSSVSYAVIKGFSLWDEFCAEPSLRHQSDIDLLISPDSVELAVETLAALGYKVEERGPGGVSMAIRSDHRPDASDFLYSPPHNRHVELHTLFYEQICGVSFATGLDWPDHIAWRTIEKVCYPALDLPHRFLIQALHVFRHTSSWARLAWLYELSVFTERFRHDFSLWSEIDRCAGNDKTRAALGIVTNLVRFAFRTTPPARYGYWKRQLSNGQQLWLERYAMEWMLSGFHSGTKVGLLLQREFADSAVAWWKYRVTRYAHFLRSIKHDKRHGPLFLGRRLRQHAHYIVHSVRWSLMED